MNYPYHCPKCEYSLEIIKRLNQLDQTEPCMRCGTPMERRVSPQIAFKDTGVQEAYYHPALGVVVKGDQHAKQLARERGLIEVGNEKDVKLTPRHKEYAV